MRSSLRSRFILVPLVAAMLAACASTGGIQPQGSLQTPAALGTQAAAAVDWPADQWWRAFGDAQLDALIARALQDAPTLAAASARVRGAAAAAAGAGAALAPRVDGDVSMQRQRVTENGLLPPPFAGAWLWQNDARLNASWDLDLFGRNRKLLDAAVGAQRAAEADAQSARVLLATNVARGYVALGRLQARRAVVDDTVRSREQILAIVRDRVNAGLDTTVELRQAEGALPEIRQQRAALDEAIALTRNALAALIGAGPQATATLVAPLAALPAPTLPASLPAELLARRADVVAARWRVESALRGVDAARAEFYPNVNLLAFAGLTSLGFSHWLEAGSRTIGIGPAIHLPIFEAGRLRANLGARSAETDGAIAAYNGALIDAVHEVADAVASRRAVDEQVSEQRQAQAAAESAYDLSLQRYRAGLGTYLTVLTAEGNVLAQRLAANDLKARTLDLDVALIRALGGGYRANADALLAAADAPAGSSPASNR